MHYTINGKDYTEFDINKRCAELMDIELNQAIAVEEGICVALAVGNYSRYLYNPCKNPLHTWPIIEKCWDELNKHCYADNRTIWQLTMQKHNCTKLIAACILYVEMNGASYE